MGRSPGTSTSWTDSALARFLHEPVDLRLVIALRRGYALLLLINVLCWGPHLDRWFSDQGWLSADAARTIAYVYGWSVFDLLPDSPHVVRIVWLILVAQSLAMLAGWRPRLQAIGCFVWLVSFQNRNPVIFDGEDTLFRLFGFLMIVMPTGCRSLREATPPGREPLRVDGWPVRLMQLEVTLVYFSAAWLKLLGSPWRDGTALYYVMHLDEYWGRFPLPAFLSTSLPVIRLLTWTTMVLEFAIPVLIWFEPTRRTALILVILFHLACDFAMHLFLFHWIMLLGWMSFAKPRDIEVFVETWGRVRRTFFSGR